MIASPLHTTRYRLAQHYLNKLQMAERATQRGRQNRIHWLNVMQQDWAQIKQWQAWSATWTDTELDKARLCSAFPLATSSALRMRQMPSESLVWMVQALEAAQKLKESEAQRKLLHLICLMHSNMEAYDAVEENAIQLLELAQAARDQVGMARAWCMLGEVKVYRGDYANAEPLFEQSLNILVANNADDELIMVWQGLGRIALWRGDYELAHTYHAKLLESCVASGKEGGAAVAHLTLSGVHIYLHEYEEAQFHAQQAVTIGRRINFTRFIPAALLSLAHAEKWLGNLESACSHYEEALAGRSLMTPSTVINGLYGLGQARFRMGELDKASNHFTEAITVARSGRILFRLCEVLPDLVVLHVVRKEVDTARILLKELVTGAMQLHTPHFMVNALGAAVLLWYHLGDVKQAAIWAGVLTNHMEHLDPILFNKSIYERLEAELGAEPYFRALKQGRALQLEDAISDLSVRLSHENVSS